MGAPIVTPARPELNDADYYERRDRLYDLLASYDEPVTCSELASAFGATSYEVRAKLGSLRVDGKVTYHAYERQWSANR